MASYKSISQAIFCVQVVAALKEQVDQTFRFWYEEAKDEVSRNLSSYTDIKKMKDMRIFSSNTRYMRTIAKLINDFIYPDIHMVKHTVQKVLFNLEWH